MNMPYIDAEGESFTVNGWKLTASVSSEVSEMDRCKDDPVAVWTPCYVICEKEDTVFTIPFDVAADSDSLDYACDEIGYLVDSRDISCEEFFGEDWGDISSALYFDVIPSLLNKIDSELTSLVWRIENDE